MKEVNNENNHVSKDSIFVHKTSQNIVVCINAQITFIGSFLPPSFSFNID